MITKKKGIELDLQIILVVNERLRSSFRRYDTLLTCLRLILLRHLAKSTSGQLDDAYSGHC